jgi:cytochrome c
MTRILAAAVAAIVMGQGAQAADAAAGAEIFAKRCATCHMIVSPGGETIVKGGKTGPNQHGLIGRTAGTQADFARYGDELKAAGEKGLVWDEAQVVAYLEDPVAFLREYLDDPRARSRMAFKLADQTDRENVASYLATLN